MAIKFVILVSVLIRARHKKDLKIMMVGKMMVMTMIHVVAMVIYNMVPLVKAPPNVAQVYAWGDLQSPPACAPNAARLTKTAILLGG